MKKLLIGLVSLTSVISFAGTSEIIVEAGKTLSITAEKRDCNRYNERDDLMSPIFYPTTSKLRQEAKTDAYTLCSSKGLDTEIMKITTLRTFKYEETHDNCRYGNFAVKFSCN